MKFIIEPCVRADVEYAAKHIRAEDKAEFEAASGMDVLGALMSSYLNSVACVAGKTQDGRVAVVFGYTVRGAVCVPWLASTDALNDLAVAREFAKVSKLYCIQLFKRFNRLENYVDARYGKCIKWLRWLGFTVDKPVRYGMNGEMFCRFYYTRGAG